MIRNRTYQDDYSAIRQAERDLRSLPITPWQQLPPLGTHPRDRLTAKERLAVSAVCWVLAVGIVSWALIG